MPLTPGCQTARGGPTWAKWPRWQRARGQHDSLPQHNLPRRRMLHQRVQHHLHALHPLLHQLAQPLRSCRWDGRSPAALPSDGADRCLQSPALMPSCLRGTRIPARNVGDSLPNRGDGAGSGARVFISAQREYPGGNLAGSGTSGRGKIGSRNSGIGRVAGRLVDDRSAGTRLRRNFRNVAVWGMGIAPMAKMLDAASMAGDNRPPIRSPL
jgi:hypothetical protein